MRKEFNSVKYEKFNFIEIYIVILRSPDVKGTVDVISSDIPSEERPAYQNHNSTL